MTNTSVISLRPLELSDAPFILELTNTPGWLQFIGDRGIHDLASAESYIRTGPQASYKEHGFGLWAVIKDNTPIGICGLLQRPDLEAPDLGFATLPQHEGKGFTKAACTLCIKRARSEYKLDALLAITMPENERSVGLLRSLGFEELRMKEKLTVFRLKA